MNGRIAIVGMACRFPDAADPAQLWENVLAGRRAFRRIPDVRMRLADYWSPDPAAPDKFYSAKAAVIEGFEFDRAEFKVPGSTYRVTDLTHWLALDTAARALKDAGFPGGEGLPKRGTAVLMGNTLTGEFTRANLMRLRWPYVRRVVGAALADHGWDEAAVTDFLRDLEPKYKLPFPPVDEDALAGGLSNTIAGRICNHFDLGGGGFTVDGACSSSLLAVAQACAALRSGQADAALAGGVDLSIDPFEVIGFAKTGALASDEMRVYDRNSNGFWPGEGCGVLVLVRQEDAEAARLHSYATIAGWGMASDGHGGMTRPEAHGHRLALERAYQIAGFDISTVGYLEGHGTGTAVGDETELRALGQARRDARPSAPPAVIGSVKANIGHTKAAAGAAGLIKAALAVHHQLIPPGTGHVEAHPEFANQQAALRVSGTAELWPADQPVRAGISAMGFGGINAHLVLESSGGPRREQLDATSVRLVSSRQDCELLLLDADSTSLLRHRIATLAGQAETISYAEMADLAAMTERDLAGRAVRAAVVASSPERLAAGLGALLTALDSERGTVIDAGAGVFLGSGTAQPRIGYLFPGQGSGRRTEGGAIAERFEVARELYRTPGVRIDGDLADTAAAQPRIVAASAAGLRVLAMLGIEAVTAAGHSLGELTSLHWAGGMDEAELIDLAAARGRVMASASDGGGAMASIAAHPDEVLPLLDGQPVVIAGYNGPRQTVVSGPAEAVDKVCGLACDAGRMTARIAVSHAFHSPAVARAATEFAVPLSKQRFRRLKRQMVSTVTGEPLPADTDVPDLLIRQVLEPVRFGAAVERMAAEVDLLVEVGPGRVLSALAAEIAPDLPVIALDTDSRSLAGTLNAVAAAYVLGAPVRHHQLYCGRLTRPMPPQLNFRFFASPCELAPADAVAEAGVPADQEGAEVRVATAEPAAEQAVEPAESAAQSLDLLRQLMAQRAELPLAAIRADSRPLDEFHFSSITVGQIVNEAARELGVSAPLTSASLATATLAELAQMLDDVARTALPGDEGSREPDGVAPWVRAFATELTEATAGPRAHPVEPGEWQVFATAGHPLAGPLEQGLRAAQLGSGVLLCLPAACDERHVGLMLDAAHAALGSAGSCRFVVVGDRRGATSLAKTLHLEAPAIATCAVTLQVPEHAQAQDLADIAARIVADVAATAGFSEVHYDDAGVRRVPVLCPLPETGDTAEPQLSTGDVLLVTGGGKGITAECALAIAKRTGAAIGLLGRSEPRDDAELTANLGRMKAAGVTYRYVRADVTSHDEVKAAVKRITAELGTVTAVLHGAGRNVPTSLSELDEDAFLRTLAPKITGFDAIMAALDADALRLLITFGSIIGRAGLRGQADYAVANDWLTDLTCKIADSHPRCRCLALEWSVWAGAGMGERLGVLESLIRDGISPIPVDDGIAALGQLLDRAGLPTPIVVMGRAGTLPTISQQRRELPLARFTAQPRVYYPGIELVADAELSADNDPYLLEHELDGELLFPAVLGIEAMAQAAAALVVAEGQPVLERAEFLRPIVVPRDGSLTIRLAALNRAGAVDVVIRCGDTDFQADHFRATLRWGASLPADERPDQAAADLPAVVLDPGRDLYGGILFQGKRFQRVVGYRSLTATSCVAEISTTPAASWFGGFLPSGLVLGDPGARDAFMHAIQCCVPHATLLPAAADRIYLGTPRDAAGTAASRGAAGTAVLTATERFRDGDSYTYDLDVRAADGELIERWEGLRLRAVRKQSGRGPWIPALLGPFLEREAPAAPGQALRCVVEPDAAGKPLSRDARRKQTKLALSRLLGRRTVVRYRADGKPEVPGEMSVSASHGAGLTFVTGLKGQVGCDVELITDRTEADWQLLLSAEQLTLAGLIRLECGEDLSVSATRVWGAVECLNKLGRPASGPIVLARCRSDGWAVLDAGDARLATFHTRVRNEATAVSASPGSVISGQPSADHAVIFTILTEGGG